MQFRFEDVCIKVNIPDREALLAEVAARLARRDGFALATINLDHLVKLRDSEAFRKAYARHDFVVADGNPIVWLSKVARQPVKLVPGSDLLVPLAQLAALQGVEVAIVGSMPEAVDGAVAHLRRMVPGLKLAARISPAMGFDPSGPEADRILDQIADSGARMCFVALGAPRQEELAARAAQLLPEIGFVSIGAGIDFLSGHQRRAPEWMRRIAMEWAYRLVSNPKRLFRRYLACAAILPEQFRQALALRRAGAQTSLVFDQPGPSAAQPVEPVTQHSLGFGKFTKNGEEGLLEAEALLDAKHLGWIDQQSEEPPRLSKAGR